eukprot:403341276
MQLQLELNNEKNSQIPAAASVYHSHDTNLDEDKETIGDNQVRSIDPLDKQMSEVATEFDITQVRSEQKNGCEQCYPGVCCREYPTVTCCYYGQTCCGYIYCCAPGTFCCGGSQICCPYADMTTRVKDILNHRVPIDADKQIQVKEKKEGERSIVDVIKAQKAKQIMEYQQTENKDQLNDTLEKFFWDDEQHQEQIDEEQFEEIDEDDMEYIETLDDAKFSNIIQ